MVIREPLPEALTVCWGRRGGGEVLLTVKDALEGEPVA